MKALFIFLCFSVSLKSFSQSRELIDSINDVIGPEYILDVDTLPTHHSYNSFNETALTANGVKEIIIAASTTTSTKELNKIFVLERKNNHVKIIDTSAEYEIDGHGPWIKVGGDYLSVFHGFSHGSNSLTYQFNTGLNRYILSNLSYGFIEPNKPDKNHGIAVDQKYDIQNQILTLNTRLYNYPNDNWDKEKTKKIFRKLPPDLTLKLRDMKDPYDYDVFLTDGPVYEQMMKY